MAYSVRNVQKFLDDLFEERQISRILGLLPMPNRTVIIAKMERYRIGNMLPAETVQHFLSNPLFELFAHVATNDADHVRIGLADLATGADPVPPLVTS